MHKQYFYIEKHHFLDPHTIQLDRADSHHIIKVWRKSIGDKVYAKTYDRRELELEIIEIQANGLRLKIRSSVLTGETNERSIFCFLSIPKLSVLSSILPKLSELDVEACVPLITKRSFLKKEKQWNHNRFLRIVNESFKQCGRIKPMRLLKPILLHDIKQTQKEIGPLEDMDLIVCFEGESKTHIMHRTLSKKKCGFLIGPEGGIELDEIEFLKSEGFKSVSIGNNVLKVETATIACLSYIKAMYYLENK